MQDLPSQCLLVTSDVTTLSTKIPQEEGMNACKEALNTRNAQDPPTYDAVHLIALILKKNNFSFNEENYVQKHGTAMGTRMAPSFANIFMDKLEKSLLPRPTHENTIWWRHTDNNYLPSGHTVRKVDKIHRRYQHISRYHQIYHRVGLRSSSRSSIQKIHVICDRSRLFTDLHTKPTNTHQYLHCQSCHASHYNTGVAYGQALHFRRICSKSTDYECHVEELKGNQIKRG